MSAFTNENGISARPVSDTGRLSPLRVFAWSVRREIWEYRWLTLFPLLGAGIVLLGVMLVALRAVLSGDHHLSITPDQRQQVAAVSAIVFRAMLDMGLAVVLICALFASIAYCMGALHNERRDRTILFWKSLPVSNVTTVLAKAFIPFVVLPAAVCVGGVVIEIALAIGVVVLKIWFALPLVGFWTGLPLLQTQGMLLDRAAFFALSMAPLFGWFLAVSSAARRSPALWGFGIPFGIVAVEKVAFGHSLVGAWIQGCIERCFQRLVENAHISLTKTDMNTGIQAQTARIGDTWHFVTLHNAASPPLWGGVIGAAVCIAFAIWMRRRQEPM